MERIFTILGAFAALLAVLVGTFGAHGLEGMIGADMYEKHLPTFLTGTQYHMYHALALFAVAWACGRFGGKLPAAAGWFFLAGIFFFSGSLYAITLTGIGAFGMIAPIGGTSFMVGWVLLGITAMKGKAANP